MEYTRSDLIDICERAAVHPAKWRDRDSCAAQAQVGAAWMLLRSGAEFRVRRAGSCTTDDKTVWVDIQHGDFASFEHSGGSGWHLYYLPTDARLAGAAGGDWY